MNLTDLINKPKIAPKHWSTVEDKSTNSGEQQAQKRKPIVMHSRTESHSVVSGILNPDCSEWMKLRKA